MANEILLLEYTAPKGGEDSSIGGRLVTSQFLDYGALSAQVNASTSYVIIKNLGSTVAAIKQGDSTVSAALNTDGNDQLVAGEKSDPFPVSSGLDYFDNATS